MAGTDENCVTETRRGSTSTDSSTNQQASSPSAIYRVRKFVARNRVVVATGTVVFVALVIAATAWLDAAAEEMVHLNHAQRRQLCAANVERVAEWRARMHGAVREEVRQHQCPIEQLRPRDGVSQRDELIAQAKLRCVQ